jgi:hypothetical protein
MMVAIIALLPLFRRTRDSDGRPLPVVTAICLSIVPDKSASAMESSARAISGD